jgi:hypothetical protein
MAQKMNYFKKEHESVAFILHSETLLDATILCLRVSQIVFGNPHFKEEKIAYCKGSIRNPLFSRAVRAYLLITMVTTSATLHCSILV